MAPSQAQPISAVSEAPGGENPHAVTIAVWTPPASSPALPREEVQQVSAPVALYTDSLPATYDGEYDTPIWAVVTRGARLHAGPDVSSSTTWFYAAGAKLHLTGYRQGWFKVVDPETSRTGYIFAQHYLYALRAPDAKPALVATKTTNLVHTASAEPTEMAPAKQAVKHAWRNQMSLLAPSDTVEQPVAPSRPQSVTGRSDGVASLLDRALRR